MKEHFLDPEGFSPDDEAELFAQAFMTFGDTPSKGIEVAKELVHLALFEGRAKAVDIIHREHIKRGRSLKSRQLDVLKDLVDPGPEQPSTKS
jgi:hypothetical protein